jgi:hypothetical protein
MIYVTTIERAATAGPGQVLFANGAATYAVLGEWMDAAPDGAHVQGPDGVWIGDPPALPVEGVTVVAGVGWHVVVAMLGLTRVEPME